MLATRVGAAMLTRKQKGKRRAIDTTYENVEVGVKRAKVRGLPTSSPPPTPVKALAKVGLELENIEVSHKESIELIGKYQVRD